MGISVLAEAQKEMRARWSKGVGTVPTKKDEQQGLNRRKCKPGTKARVRIYSQRLRSNSGRSVDDV